MKAISWTSAVIAITAISSVWQATALSAQTKSAGISKWEYRVLPKEQVLDLGKKDLAAGLNKLGEEGWELAAVDGVYIFKRASNWNRQQSADLKRQLDQAESDVEMWKDRAAWSARMAKKGLMSDRQAQADMDQLRRAEMALEQARKELQTFPGDSKGTPEKEGK